MSQMLLYDEIIFDKSVDVEDILNTPDDNDIGYFVEGDLRDSDDTKRRQEISRSLL